MQGRCYYNGKTFFPPLTSPQNIELKKTAENTQLIQPGKTQQLAKTLTSSNLCHQHLPDTIQQNWEKAIWQQKACQFPVRSKFYIRNVNLLQSVQQIYVKLVLLSSQSIPFPFRSANWLEKQQTHSLSSSISIYTFLQMCGLPTLGGLFLIQTYSATLCHVSFLQLISSLPFSEKCLTCEVYHHISVSFPLQHI